MNISTLTALTPDAHRAERVRARCRARLERGHRRSRRLAAFVHVGRRVIPPVFAAVLYAAYLADLVHTALRTLSRAT